MKRSIALFVFALLSAAIFVLAHAALAQGGSDAPLPPASPHDSAAARSVTVDNFSFSPATVTIPAGTTIAWTNRDDVPHTVTSEDQKFRSKALDTDETFSHTFDTPGTYSYFCSIHPQMTAKVIVKGVK